MIMRLQHQRPDGEVDTYHLKPGRRYHIGRGSACEVRILDLKLSRKHCAVEFSDGAWQVIDLLSTNGCKLDGEQIIGTVPLVTGNAIEAGQTQLIVAEIVDNGAAPVSVRRVEDEDTTHSDGEQTRSDAAVVQGRLAAASDSGTEEAAEHEEPDHTETTRAPLEQDEMPEDDSRIEPAIDSSDFTPEPLAEALTKTASLIPHPGMPRTPVVTAA
ncbi:MAG: FHA domain-containing protein, partial [Planctomycetes bacterium]|nr:FHA domain-containing protein [Planctomycetota bacterium]